MKNKNETRKAKMSISAFVFGYLKGKDVVALKGKDLGAALIPLVQRNYPGSKFKQTHVSWYLSQARRQKKAKLPMDKLHGINRAKGNGSKTGGLLPKKGDLNAARVRKGMKALKALKATIKGTRKAQTETVE